MDTDNPTPPPLPGTPPWKQPQAMPVSPAPTETPASESTGQRTAQVNPLTGFASTEAPDASGASVTLTHLGPAYEVTDGVSGKVFAPGVSKQVTQEDADRLMAAHPYERWQTAPTEETPK